MDCVNFAFEPQRHCRRETPVTSARHHPCGCMRRETIDRLAGSGAPSIGSRHLLSYPTTNMGHIEHSQAARTGFILDMRTTWPLAVIQIERPRVVLTQL